MEPEGLERLRSAIQQDIKNGDCVKFLEMVRNRRELAGIGVHHRKRVRLLAPDQGPHLDEAEFGPGGISQGLAVRAEPGPCSTESAGARGCRGLFNALMRVDAAKEPVAVLMTGYQPCGVSLLQIFPLLVCQPIDDRQKATICARRTAASRCRVSLR